MKLLHELEPTKWLAIHNGKSLIVWEWESELALMFHIMEIRR